MKDSLISAEFYCKIKPYCCKKCFFNNVLSCFQPKYLDFLNREAFSRQVKIIVLISEHNM